MKVFLNFAFLLFISVAVGMHSSFGTRVSRLQQEKILCEHVVQKYGKKIEDNATKFRYYDLHLALKTQFVVQYCKFIELEQRIQERNQEADD